MDKDRNLFSGPTAVDLLIDSQKHIQRVLEDHTNKISENQICTLRKFGELRQDINKMKEEIKEEIGKHCQEQQTTCRYNHDKVDNAIAKKLPKWVFTTMLVITMAVFGWLVDTVVANKSYIDGHKAVNKIEEKKRVQPSPVP